MLKFQHKLAFNILENTDCSNLRINSGSNNETVEP